MKALMQVRPFLTVLLAFCISADLLAAQKRALLIGVGYTADKAQCFSCNGDVNGINSYLSQHEFMVTSLTNEQATVQAVTNAFVSLANISKPGDMLVVYFSGHGSQMADYNGDEEDGWDETWVLYDNELTDDTINELWAKFAERVNIIFISDSCNSASVFKLGKEAATNSLVANSQAEASLVKSLPPKPDQIAIVERRMQTNDFSDTFPATSSGTPIKCSIISLAACEDGEKAEMGIPYSVFTQSLLRAVARFEKAGKVSNYVDLMSAVRADLAAHNKAQIPQLKLWGEINMVFVSSFPFGNPARPIGANPVVPGAIVSVSAKTSSGMVHKFVGEVDEYNFNSLKMKEKEKTKEIPRGSIESLNILKNPSAQKTFELSVGIPR